jgi:nucleotide-binding universal stress UspA family protein
MNIMVCYDGSSAAGAALEVAKGRAKNFDAKIFLVTSMISGPQVPRDEFVKREKELEKVKRQLFKEDVQCETTLSVRGFEPGEDLVIFARENEIDEIVIGIKKLSKVGKFIFGSTAQYVILEAPCPVLTVK